MKLYTETMASAPNRVQHNYHDNSREIEPENHLHGSCALAVSSTQQEAFPIRLHFVLSELEKDGMSHIASWQPHGRCFVVHNRDEFVRSVLSCYFTQSSYASFQRQCNIYGFTRLTAGPDKGGYYHEKFLKGMPFLARQIVRIKLKNNGRRKPASPESEPDFYKMPWVPLRTCNSSASLSNAAFPSGQYAAPRFTDQSDFTCLSGFVSRPLEYAIPPAWQMNIPMEGYYSHPANFMHHEQQHAMVAQQNSGHDPSRVFADNGHQLASHRDQDGGRGSLEDTDYVNQLLDHISILSDDC